MRRLFMSISNINYGAIKINNYFGLLRYPKDFKNNLDSYFEGYNEIYKTVQIRQILDYIETSENKDIALLKTNEMLNRNKDEFSFGFFNHIKECRNREGVSK